MKRYQSPLLLARLVQFRYFHLHTSQNNVISLCREGRKEDVALIPNFVLGRCSLGLRHYSSGFAGVDRIPRSFDDVRPNGKLEKNETSEGFYQPGYSGDKRGGDYVNNTNHFQQRSSPESHIPVNYGPNSLNYSAQPNLGYLGHGNATGPQQINGNWSSNSGQGQYYPGGYRRENTGVLNAYNQTDTPGGYCDAPLRPQHQNLNVSQQQWTAAYVGNPGQNNEIMADNAEGTLLKELDDACKEWDLVRAVECMKNSSSKGVSIDLPRYFALIEACGEAKALVEAKDVHKHLIDFSSPLSTSIFNRLIDMYGKCGSMNDAYDTFNNTPERNLTTWDNVISSYAKNGLGEEAIDMFTKFKESGLKPDGQMFFSLFDACGVVGDVVEGMLHFESMTKVYGITPTMDHYASIVRMFGSAGDLDGALEFIEKMPVEPSVDVWESLMNISRIQGDLELGDRCAQIVEQLDPSRLTKESKTGLLPVKGLDALKKKVKKTSLSEHGRHEYTAGDRSHPEQAKIYALLRGFKESMKEAGYVPETRFVLHDVDQEEKEEAIMAHSERLACASFLLTSSPRAQMRIIKNLRVCGDCHNVFKIISKLVGRTVVMRDQKRFHHFQDGKCSCNDYW